MSDSWTARVSAAEDRLRAGYDPTAEECGPRRSDAWCRVLGWQDQLKEEALTPTGAIIESVLPRTINS